MATPNPKNLAISPASSDLGLGDMLKTQLSDDDEERRRQQLLNAGKVGPFTQGDAASALFG